MCEKLKSENQTNMNIDMCVDIRPITSFLMHVSSKYTET